MNKKRTVTNSNKKTKSQPIFQDNIGKKIVVGFSAVIIIFMVFGIFIYLNEASVEKVTLSFSEEVLPELKLLQELKTLSLNTSFLTIEIIYIHDASIVSEQEFLEEKKADLSDAKIKFENTLLTLMGLLENDSGELITANHINGEWGKVSKTSEELLQVQKSGDKDDVIDKLVTKLDVETNHLVRDINNAIVHELQEVDESNELVKSLFSTNLQIIFFGVLFVSILSMTVGLIISKKIKQDQKIITDQKNVLQENVFQLEKLDKQKGEFLAVISHELRTPLVPIRGNCEVLLDEDNPEQLSDDQRSLIESISSNSERLSELIHKILLTQRIGLGKQDYIMKDLNVKKLIDEIFQSYSSTMEKKQIRFETLLKDNLMVNCDKKSVTEILQSLLNNAIDFVPENGNIEIGAKVDSDSVIIFVKDNGIGIPLEKQNKLFTPFYQVDSSLGRKHQGTGLGLSICKDLVQGMGGKIWLESEGKGKGTTFYFSLKKGDKK